MIEPGLGTSKFKIGKNIEEIDFSQLEIIEIEDRDIFTVYKTESIWFHFVKESKKLNQVTVFSPFSEKVLNKVGIGDTLLDVEKHFGKCCINHRVHEPLKYAGIAFETKSGSKSKNAVIDSISVSEPYAVYLSSKYKPFEFTSKKRLP